MYENASVEVTNSISGGLLFKSELFPYASSHPKDLEIFCEVFVTGTSKDVALDAFTKFVIILFVMVIFIILLGHLGYS